MFLTESWFWRGTQSAIFYYVSCAPCLEQKYKRNRRKDAVRAFKEKADIVTDQPGRVQQPGPFETNPDWAEEIIVGPGPPKGWKKEKILQRYTESAREKYRNETKTPRLPSWSVQAAEAHADASESPIEASTSLPVHVGNNIPSTTVPEIAVIDALEPGTPEQLSRLEPTSPASVRRSDTGTGSTSSEHPEQHSKSRPSMDRKLSSAVENIRDTIKGWNLKRYEREDETLSGLNERLSKMWDKATKYGADPPADGKKTTFSYGRRRAGTAGTTESDKHDWERAVRNPEINEMHPPTVSKLPANEDDAAWMLLPPPSAAVMAGRVRPQQQSPFRWPLAQIGRDQDEWDQIESARAMSHKHSPKSRSSTGDSRKTPDLSNSSSDEGWTDNENQIQNHSEHYKRHSAPVDGWMPVLPKPIARMAPQTSQHWRDEAWRPPHVY